MSEPQGLLYFARQARAKHSRYGKHSEKQRRRKLHWLYRINTN